MQITIDLPDDLYSDAQAVAKRESRSLASVVIDFIRSSRKTVAPAAPDRGVTPWKLPVVKGSRPFTAAEVDQMLEADGLP
jgi:hypothetical protein